MRWLEHRLPPPILVLVVGAAMWLLSRFPPKSPLPQSLHVGAGVVVGGLGVAIVVLGVRAFRRAGTTIDPVNIERTSSLVIAGIFKITRNPMYLGMAAILAGWGIALASAWSAFGPVLFVVSINRLQIQPEERAMLAKFGSEYAHYQASTRRWI